MSLILSAVKAFWKAYQKLLKHFKNLNTGRSERLVSHLHQYLGGISLGFSKLTSWKYADYIDIDIWIFPQIFSLN